jgi:hypothetical protein
MEKNALGLSCIPLFSTTLVWNVLHCDKYLTEMPVSFHVKYLSFLSEINQNWNAFTNLHATRACVCVCARACVRSYLCVCVQVNLR